MVPIMAFVATGISALSKTSKIAIVSLCVLSKVLVVCHYS
jgi:hypothetical protein